MNILHISKIAAFIGMLLWAMPQANAQHVTVDAKIDSLQLLIGEQAKVTLEVSLDANQKMWALINEMSTVLKLTPEEIYQGYIPDVGNNYRVFPVKPEEINQFAEEWCHGHLGRMVEDMGPCRLTNLRGYHNVKCYRGSSEYDTVTFSRLLDLVCQDCEQLGIDTLSDREKSLLLDEWEATRNA